jgi:hypothetical protein|tara:strand:+ start:4753 stop:4953 length:201 start_codon:yes stop_codon:yes gene_type:complete
MRNQLVADLNAKLNIDASTTVKDLLEKHNALAAQVESLIALLEANKADITAVDFAGESEDNAVSID